MRLKSVAREAERYVASEIMKKYLIIIIGLLLSQIISAQDTVKVDTIQMAQNIVVNKPDSVTYVMVTKEITFIERYQGLIGAFIGAFFASLIAIIAIKKTHKNQIELENDKIHYKRYQDEKVYCGFLFSIHSVLLNHKQFLMTLKKELEGILENAKITGKLAYDKPYTFLPVDLLKGNLNNVLSYENYNSKNIQLLVSYLNFVENLYNDLNLINLVKLKDDTKDENEYKQKIEYYFNEVLGRINILKEMVEELLNAIIEEIENSETSNVFH